jgi:hypothetical protein
MVLERELREVEPTWDGWRRFEPTGRVIVGTDVPGASVAIAEAASGRVVLVEVHGGD